MSEETTQSVAQTETEAETAPIETAAAAIAIIDDGYRQCGYCTHWLPVDQFTFSLDGRRIRTCEACRARKHETHVKRQELSGLSISEPRTALALNPEVWKAHPLHTHLAANALGCIVNIKTGRLQGSLCISGYIKLVVKHEGKFVNRYAHRIVYECFNGVIPQDETREVCHNDSNRSNNAISNLRLDTHQANVDDRVNHAVTEFRTALSPERDQKPPTIRARRSNLAKGRWDLFANAEEAANACNVTIPQVYESANAGGHKPFNNWSFRFKR